MTDAFRPLSHLDEMTGAASNPHRRRMLGSLGALIAMAGGCGGSGGTGDLAGVGSGGTGSAFGFGFITGFGSIIVNGIKYDDTRATVTDDLGATRGKGELQIGMMVEIRGTVDDNTGQGTADTVRVISELKGPVSARSIDAVAPVTGGTLTVLGTTVRATAATVWPDGLNLAGLAVGEFVEVWGFADRSTNPPTITATRIERKEATDDGRNRLRGLVTEITPGVSMRVGGQAGSGGQVFDLRDFPSGPAGVTVGKLVKLVYRVSGAVLVATKVESESASAPSADTRVRIEGRVSQFASKSSFQVEGLSVDASTAGFVDGTESQLLNGARVRVEGAMVAGRLKATTVRFRDDSSGSSSGSGSGSGSGSASSDNYGNEVEGQVSQYASLASFKVRDAYGREFVFDGRTATGKDGAARPAFGLGSAIKVKFLLGGSPLVATEIRLNT